MKAELQLRCDYHYWANERLLGAAEQLSDEQLWREVLPQHSSALGILVHIVGAEWAWQQRIAGVMPTAMPAAAEFPTLAALRTRWRDEEHSLRALIDGLSDEALQRVTPYRTLSGWSDARPLWQILAHLFNHATQHRAEVAAILTILGSSPGDLDMIRYLRALPLEVA